MTQPEASAAQSWVGTSDAVLRGLNHEFSNRLSVSRLSAQFSATVAAGNSEIRRLAADAGRDDDLLRLLHLYRLMVFAATESPEPVLVADVATDAVALFLHHSEFRDIECRLDGEAATPPVLMNPVSLTQAVLLLLCAAARGIEADGAPYGVITLRWGAEQDAAVRITAEATDSGGHEATAEVPELSAVRWLIRHAEGTADAGHTDTGTYCAGMTIGTLVRLRQREKQG